ncbi:SET domain-containing protein 4 isoform X3 [Canis aureus]
MKKGGGRTSRIRRRKLFRCSVSRGVNESYKPEFIELKKWLKDRKFEDTNLIPACFPGTGRGLMSKTSLREGQMIISLPESCLITTDTVIRSYLGTYIAKWQPPPSPLLALCTFLVSEKHAGDQSLWKPYLEILPQAYTCPVCLEPEVVNLFPKPLKAKAEEQRARVQEFFSSSRDFFSSLQPLFSEAVESIFSYRALLWAWCTVNTRAVYVKHRQRQCFSTEPNTYALAPYLDLLNHSPEVQVKGAFNEETRCYEIRTASNCRKHEEVFICYGPHDNQRLLLEYGFVSIHNPHACVYVSEDILVKYLPTTDKQMNKKISILKDHDFIENLTFGWDGPSWRLLTALKLLCLEAEELVLVRVGMAQQQGQALLFPAATGKDALGGRSAGQHHSLPSSLLCLQGHLWKSGECVSVFKMQGLCEAFGRASGSTRGGGFAWPALSQSQKQSGV